MKEARLLRLGLVFGLLFLVLIARLFQMQVLQGPEWAQEAFRSRLQTQSLPFHRGRILDCRQQVLAEDERAWDLMFEYRAFRRAHPAGQILEAYTLLGQAPGGLPQCLAQAESLLAGLLRCTPADLGRLGSGGRSDWLYYLRQLGDFQDGRALADWAEHGSAPLGQALAPAYAHFHERAESARAAMGRLEQALHMQRGQLLDELEEQRLDLERRVRDLALRAAAGRGFSLSAYQVADLLGAHPGDAEARQQFLTALAQRWKLAPTPEGLEVLARVLTGASDGDPEQQRLEQGQLLRHVEGVAPSDTADLRRELIRDVHSSRVMRLRKDVPFDVVDLIEQDPAAYPGFRVVENPHRDYPADLDPQLVGLVQAPSEAELRRYQDLQEEGQELARLLDPSPEQERRAQEVADALARSLRTGEVRGGSGVEASCEQVLRGVRGDFELLHESEEQPPTELTYQPPRAGQDVRLSLDLGLQRAAEQAIVDGYALARSEAEARGASPEVLAALRTPRCGFVLLDLRDGSVPVLATAPSYSVASYRQSYPVLAADPGQPLRHRGLAGNFPAAQTPYPGSTFKLVVAVEALSEDPAWWTRPLSCEGQYQPPGASRALLCEGVHGTLSMRAAIAESCNVYFYKLGESLGYEAVYRRARALGFGQPSGLDLDCRAADGGGFELYGANAVLERGAFLLRPPGQVHEAAAACHLAIGQSYVTASPLQMARAFGWLACGRLWTPRLVLEQAGTPSAPASSEPPLDPELRARLLLAFRDVVEAEKGTAHDPEHDLSAFHVAGKTGTAQALEARATGQPEIHGWFAGFFPYEEPRYAFALLCENAGVHGGDSANLVLYEFLRATDGLRER